MSIVMNKWDAYRQRLIYNIDDWTSYYGVYVPCDDGGFVVAIIGEVTWIEPKTYQHEGGSRDSTSGWFASTFYPMFDSLRCFKNLHKLTKGQEVAGEISLGLRFSTRYEAETALFERYDKFILEAKK